MAEGVSTSMDQLVELLEKNTMIKMSEAAKELGVDKQRIESWARMLEKAEAVELHYSVIGGAVLKRGPKFDSVSRKKKTQEQEKALAEMKPAVTGSLKSLMKEKIEIPEKIQIPKGVEGDQKFLLIRKQIEDEEKVIDTDIKHLQEEEGKVVDYMKTLIEEGKKLTDYINSLRGMLEDIEKSKTSQKGGGEAPKQKG